MRKPPIVLTQTSVRPASFHQEFRNGLMHEGVYCRFRRCRTILIVDAEHDPAYSFSAYQKLKQAASEDLHADLNVPCIEKILSGTSAFSADTPIMEGTTSFEGGPNGKIFYLKLSLHEALFGDRTAIVKSYAEMHTTFPQESTANQYFGPDRFRAYRALGYAITRNLGRDITS